MYNLSGATNLRIMAIDGGTRNIGLAFLDVNLENLTIERSTAFTLNSERNRENNQYLPSDGDEVYLRLKALEKPLSRIMEIHAPDEVVMESPFMNYNRPGAYGPLVQCITMIKCVVKQYRYTMSPWHIPPSNVKNAVGAPGDCKKELVREMVLAKVNELKFSGEYDLSCQSEHAMDAIAIAYARYNMLKIERQKYVAS